MSRWTPICQELSRSIASSLKTAKLDRRALQTISTISPLAIAASCVNLAPASLIFGSFRSTIPTWRYRNVDQALPPHQPSPMRWSCSDAFPGLTPLLRTLLALEALPHLLAKFFLDS
eukprot:4493478-Pleurochrysis_carterae.AAC.1